MVARQMPGKRFPRASNDPDEVTRRQIPFSRRGKRFRDGRTTGRLGARREDEDDDEADDYEEMKLDPTTRASVFWPSRFHPSTSFPRPVVVADRLLFSRPRDARADRAFPERNCEKRTRKVYGNRRPGIFTKIDGVCGRLIPSITI